MRKPQDMSPEEQNAYLVCQQQLSDGTLSDSQHQVIRARMEKLEWTTPAGEINGRLTKIEERLDKVEAVLAKNPWTPTTGAAAKPPAAKPPAKRRGRPPKSKAKPIDPGPLRGDPIFGPGEMDTLEKSFDEGGGK